MTHIPMADLNDFEKIVILHVAKQSLPLSHKKLGASVNYVRSIPILAGAVPKEPLTDLGVTMLARGLKNKGYLRWVLYENHKEGYSLTEKAHDGIVAFEAQVAEMGKKGTDYGQPR